MASQAQLEANRRNAQKSTGPKTPEGRAAVRLNGLRHGLASGILVLEGESEADFENLLDSLAAEHQPATPTEVLLVRQMAMAGWRLQRIVHMEAAHYRLRRSDLEDYFEKHYTDLAEPDRLAIIADRDDHTLINFSRYEARLERSFHKALTALERLRAQRNSKMTNQSQFPQRAETASTSAAATPPARLVQPNKLRLEPASPMNRPPNPIHSPVPPALPPSPS